MTKFNAKGHFLVLAKEVEEMVLNTGLVQNGTVGYMVNCQMNLFMNFIRCYIEHEKKEGQSQNDVRDEISRWFKQTNSHIEAAFEEFYP